MPRRGLPPGLIWPTLAMVPVLALLIGLGLWQWQRLGWKLDLIARIEQRIRAEPVTLAAALRRHEAGEDIEYLKVRTRGRYDHASERYLYMPAPDGSGGYHVFTDLETDDGFRLVVNRGFVDEARASPDRRPQGLIDGPVDVTGLVRRPETPGAFTPAGDAGRRLFFHRDLAGMQRLRPPRSPGHTTVPFFLDADSSPVAGGWPKGGTTILAVPNRHLEYSLTWWGLAASLIIVYGALIAPRLRR